MNYTHEFSIVGSVATIKVKGRLTHENLIELEQMVENIAEENQISHLCVDMSKADYLPSFCFGILISSCEILKNKGVEMEVILQPYHANLARSIGVEAVCRVTLAKA